MTIVYTCRIADAFGVALDEVANFVDNPDGGGAALDYALNVGGVGALSLTLPVSYPKGNLVLDGRIGVWRSINGRTPTLDGQAIFLIRKWRYTAEAITVTAYHAKLSERDRAICDLLAAQIADALPDAEHKVWHGSPVWFLDGNPIVGYGKLKDCVRLMFWSGQSFTAPGLAKEGSFKAAEARYTDVGQVDTKRLAQWLAESREVQWDYKNIVKRKGKLERLK